MSKGIKKLGIIASVCMMVMVSGCGNQAPDSASASEQQTQETVEIDAMQESTTEAVEEIREPVKKEKEVLPQVSQEEVPQYEGYTLLWNDEFNGDTLNEEIWGYTLRAPKVTNSELQEYTNAPENVFVKDGYLTIKAIKTTDDKGNDYYTSGKIITRGKQDFTYGKVEVRARVPEGQGLWPAIWMMPSKEGIYGNWPKGGEIDIMEILGHDVKTSYATIHYGEPHEEQQGVYALTEGSFEESFHVFSLEWEPGEMRFYIDGNLFHTVNDWFSGSPGVEYDYPAPFDQNFYMQLNLAVGGTWPGDPDETTDFVNAEFDVDYVRVYQKPEYDMNVTKPEKAFREPLADGNLIYNGDLAESEDLSDETNWVFLLNEGGTGSAAVKDGAIVVTPEDEGSVDYAQQLIQGELPLYNGKKYCLTFEASAAEERSMKVCVSGPNANWIRYLQDTSVALTTQWQTYTYEFEMEEKDDNNARVEFNMGNADSLAEISIKNVRLEVVE